MKKTILKTTTLAAIASFMMSGVALAHHPLEDINADLYERIDDIISDTNSQHNEVMDAMLEDQEDDAMMANTSQSMDGSNTMTQVDNGAATSSMTVEMGETASGFSNAGQSRAGARIR